MRYLALLLFGVLGVVGPNLLWLGRSTLRIDNRSAAMVDSIAYRACDTIHPVGGLGSGRFAFRVLEPCGDDTLVVFVGESEHCQLYVEGELYHIDARINAAGRVECTYARPFSSLLIAKALW